YAKSIIAYGYPKVHYGKNILNVAETKDPNLGVKRTNDAWIYISSWGSYYFAVPFVKIADNFSDIYLKTALLRVSFAFFGFLGVLIFVYVGSLFFDNKIKKLLFANFFLIFEILSIPLILHIRQVRHYPITIFLVSLIFLLLVKKLVFQTGINSLIYNFSLFILLFLLMNVYFPAFVSVLLFICLIASLKFIIYSRRVDVVRENIFIFLIILILFPYFSFFEFFKISSIISSQFGYDLSRFIFNLKTALYFFVTSEYFLLVLILFLVLIFFVYKNRNLFKDKLVIVSMGIFLYLLLSLMVCSRIPYFFERYYIFLQPFVILLFLFLSFKLYDFLNQGKNRNKTLFYFYFLFLGIVINIVFKFENIKGYIYELANPYRGPMDYLVSYILANYRNPESLVIATNYEEYVLMYYLNSKVIVGYVGNNLKEDLKARPDIVVIRKNRPNFVPELKSFLEKGKYKEVIFNVYDYQVNNIPETTLSLKHLFKLPPPRDDSEKLSIFTYKE
ncbi:MAG: hypothetical protein ACPLZ9_04685, partial [Candidatus Ratteibacteria bacterium]